MKIAVRLLFFALIAAGAATVSGEEVEYATLDRLFIKVDTPLRAVLGKGMVSVLVYHTYPTTLRHFKLVPKSDHFDIVVEPEQMDEFKPTTIETFALHLVVKGQPKSDRVLLSVGVAADEVRSDKQFTFTVPLTKKAEKEVNDALAMPVGEIELYVRRFGEEIYYLYVIPTVALLGWLLWRKRRAARGGKSET
jgi:hypothetical protein